MYRFTLLCLLTLLIIPIAHAKIYKCEKNGNVYYTSKASAECHEKKIKTKQPAGASEQLDAIRAKNKAFEERRHQRLEKQKKQAQEAASNKQKQQNCERAKRNLAGFQDLSNRYVTDDQGNRQAITDEQRQEKIKKNQKAIKEFCK